MSGRSRRAALVPAVLLAGGLTVAATVAGLWSRGEGAAPADARALPALPAAPASALVVRTPRPLGDEPHLSRWSPVVAATTARRAPSPGAAAVGHLEPTTPEQTANVVPVLGRAKDAAGRVWVRVRLPMLPNGTTGWVPRKALGGYTLVRTRLVVDRARLTVTLLRDGKPIFRADVGVGRAEWPTPPGEFVIRNRLTRFANPFYGPLAFGTSARSSVLTDWPAGGFVGIHGTNEPELIPGRVSHGCIRLRNADIVKLDSLMPIGTPVTIQ